MTENVVSLIMHFFLAFDLYLGIYVLSLNNKSYLNRAFFGLCMSIAIWTFAFAVANSAKSIDEVLIWRRISVLGWGTFFSLLLDFSILLTNKPILLKHKWLYLLIYMPAILNLWVFGIYTPIADKQYNLFHGGLGWYHITENTEWEIFFRIYYILFTLLTVLTFLYWVSKQTTKETKRKGILIAVSILSGAFLGTLTNFVLNAYFDMAMPQIEMVFIAIPMIILWRNIKDFELLEDKVEEDTYKEGEVLTKATHRKLLELIARLYMIAAFILFGFKVYFDGVPILKILPITLLLFCIGATLLVTITLDITSNKIDKILKYLLLLTIPLVGILTISDSAIYGFAVPSIIILLSVTFNDRHHTKRVIAVTLGTYILFWLFQPSTMVVFEYPDHIGRIIIFLLIAMVGLFIHNIYTKRLTVIERQINQELFLRECILLLSELTPENMRIYLGTLIEKVCTYSGYQNGIILFNTEEMDEIYNWYGCQMNQKNELTIKMALRELLSERKYNDNFGLGSDWLTQNDLKMNYTLDFIKSQDQVQGIFLLFNLGEKIKTNPVFERLKNFILDRLSLSLSEIHSDLKIKKLLYIDEVTGLPGRRYLNEYMKTLDLNQEKYALVLIGLNNINTINEALGYREGDLFLRSFAHHIDQIEHKSHVTTRFFSDVFAIVFRGQNTQEEIEDYIDSLLSKQNNRTIYDKVPFPIKMSAGCAMLNVNFEKTDVSTYELVQQQADLALNLCIKSGENKLVFYDESAKKQFFEALLFENDLQHAIENQEFELYYQPKVNLMTEEIIGLEALIRWHHPERGFVPPDFFLEVAEKNGWMRQIDFWVFEKACKQISSWNEKNINFHTLAINLTPTSFISFECSDLIIDNIKKYDVNPSHLEIEITETLSFNLSGHVLECIDNIRRFGVTVALDDFGVAYSSLSRLHHLPVDHLKIDKKFIDEAVTSERGMHVLKNIINMGNDLSLELTAEGVETQEQVDLLRKLGCSQGQGYFFYRPMNVEGIESLFKTKTKYSNNN